MMGKDARMHLRISADLKEFAEDYAERRNSSVTELVTRFFTNLREQERKRAEETPDAESI